MAWVAPQIANAWETSTFNALFDEIKARTQTEPLEATWTACMISAAGLGAIGIDTTDLPAADGSTAFKAGMAGRATQIGDAGPNAPTAWLAPFQPGGGVHALVVVAADDPEDLATQVENIANQASAFGCEVVFQETGATLPAPLTGHEHFGFKDGISQPAIEGDDSPSTGAHQAVPAGEFVLGYPDALGNTNGADTKWNNGSYVVFRRLRQDVAHFRQLITAGVPNANPAVAGDELGAKMIGRWTSGAPIEKYPDGDPGPGHEENDFAYQQADAGGLVCPVWAHIRKANPRDELAPGGQPAGAEQHRMLRRGIPFGSPLPEGVVADDGVQRGLHFFCVVGDLARQFEFVQNNWINNSNFPIGSVPAQPGGPYQPPTPGTPAGGPDPIVGEHDDAAAVTFAQQSGSVPLPLAHELVTVTAGEYFFLPSISALLAISA